MEPLPLYESLELRQVTGPTLRPGGFTLTDRLADYCRLTKSAAMLDIGCGLGVTVGRLTENRGLKAVGLDASLNLLRDGRAADPSLPLAAGLAQWLPFRDLSFDGVLCECVLSLVDHPGQALAEFSRVLKPEGWLMVTDLYARRPEGAIALNQLPLNSCLKGARPRQDIMRLVESAGFEPALWEDHTCLLNQLAAKLVFEFGSMARLWSLFARDGAEEELQCSLDGARPGYYLMAASKRG